MEVARPDQGGVDGNGAPRVLAVDFGQAHHGDLAAGKQFPQHRPRPHAGKLVGVPHQHHLAPRLQGAEQVFRQVDVQHGRLVHQDQVRVQGFRLGIDTVLPGQ